MSNTASTVLFFPTSYDLRGWLVMNHTLLQEQWIGFYKKTSGMPSITWPESVDEALCFGWIDGLRKSIDENSYKIRFTPRKPSSHWSAVNINRVEELKKMGLMETAGLEAFLKLKIENSAKAAHEQKNIDLSSDYEIELKKNSKAWDYWESKAPGYRKQVIWWIMSAKKEETRLKRLQVLIATAQNGEVIPPLKWSKTK